MANELILIVEDNPKNLELVWEYGGPAGQVFRGCAPEAPCYDAAIFCAT